MRKGIAAGSLLVLLLFGVWWLVRGDPPRNASSPSPQGIVPTPTEPVRSVSAPTQPSVLAEQKSDQAPERESIRTEAPTPAPAPAASRAHVFGKLAGEDGVPVAGASLWLDCDGEWAKGVEMPSVEIHGYRTHAFETKSDAEGKFEFDVPVPTSDWVMFFFESDEFHSIDGRDFGPAGGRNQARLKVGDNDLETFHLAWTGSIEGTVHASDGSPIAKAEVTIHGALPGARVLHCRSESDGTFHLGHVPPGSWTLKAKCEGFLSLEKKSVDVEARRRTSGMSVVLEHGPTITGVVVDERGAPVGGVRIEGWPAHSGQGAQTKSAADGSFTMAIPQNDAYRFDIAAPGFEHLGGYTSTAYEPGTRDVRLVLKRSREVDVPVVDAETGAAVEMYGIALSVTEHDGWHTDEPLEAPGIVKHAGGRARVSLDRGKVMARVLAPGYAAVSVQLEVPGDARETLPIRLVRASSISGRVGRAGAPRASARVELASAWIKRDVSKPDEPEEELIFSDNYFHDIAGFGGRGRDATLDAEGRFRFDDLPAGHYRLVVRDAGTAPYVIESIAIATKQALDLGEIVLRAGCSIRGRIVPAPTPSVGRWEVTLDRPYAREHAEVDSTGAFRFDGVDPGKHVLVVKCEDSIDEPIPMLEIDVAAGEIKDVVLDVGALVPARVTVHVTRGGLPVEGVQVIGYCEATRQENRIGELTNAHGMATGNCAPGDAVRFSALSNAQLLLGEQATAVRVSAGESIDISLAINAGRARVQFPAGFVVPPRARAVVILDTEGSHARRRVVMCETPDCPMKIGVEWKDPAIDLGEIAQGEYELSVDVSQASESTGASVEFRTIAPPYRGKLVVKADETAICALVPYEANK